MTQSAASTSKPGPAPGAAPASPRHCAPAAVEREVKFRVEGLDLYYGSHQALIQVTAEIRKGEITALIGPSGCGKSTFLRCLNRMNELIAGVRTGGLVKMDDVDLYDRRVDVVELRKRVGMVFQKPNPFPMSIFDNVAAGPRIHGVRHRARLEEIVEQSLRGASLWEEVKDSLTRSALALSGGQQQRLCIARALAIEPEVILMDEPCSALDPISTFRVEELMTQLSERYTIVLVTHNMYQASRVSQRTGFFLLGELVEMGPTAEIFERPRDQRTDDYVRGRFG